VDAAGPVEAQQQRVEDPRPGAVPAPAVEAIVDGLPGPIALGRVGPRGAGMQVPEDAVDQRAMVVPGMAGPAVVVAIGEEGGDPLPLSVGEIEAVHGWPPSGNLPAREKGSTSILLKSAIVRNDLGRIGSGSRGR